MRKTTVRRLGILGVAAVAAIGVAACGDDSGDGSSGGDSGDNAEVVAVLVDQGATQDEAECVVDELGDEAEFLLSEEEPPQDVMDRWLEAVQMCSETDLDLEDG